MGRLVLRREAKELCLESWALAARALFHRALISMEARYKVWTGTHTRKHTHYYHEHGDKLKGLDSHTHTIIMISMEARYRVWTHTIIMISMDVRACVPVCMYVCVPARCGCWGAVQTPD